MTNKLSHIFECSDHITEKQYRTSRALFILDGCASTQIFTVTSGAFLSGLAYLVGAGTALTGIIAALPTLMNRIPSRFFPLSSMRTAQAANGSR